MSSSSAGRGGGGVSGASPKSAPSPSSRRASGSLAGPAAPPEQSIRYATRVPRTAFIDTYHTGTAPLKKNWSYYKRTGNVWEDVDHIPPARLKMFLRPDLGYAAAQAINKRYEQEQALADMRSWAHAMHRARQRQRLAQQRELREQMEEYVGIRRPQQSGSSPSRASSGGASGVVPLPQSLVAQAHRTEEELKPRTLEDAHLHGPGFDPLRSGLEHLFFPRHGYAADEPFVQVGRYTPKRLGERPPPGAPGAARAETLNLSNTA